MKEITESRNETAMRYDVTCWVEQGRRCSLVTYKGVSDPTPGQFGSRAIIRIVSVKEVPAVTWEMVTCDGRFSCE